MFRLGLVAVTALLVATADFPPQARADSVSDFLAKWDPDHDKTLDLAEINKAADAEFDKLDADHDGTLSPKELSGRLTEAEFKAADTDHDGTVSKAEYKAIVAERFKAANPDSDTTIDIAELKTEAGHHLLLLLE